MQSIMAPSSPTPTTHPFLLKQSPVTVTGTMCFPWLVAPGLELIAAVFTLGGSGSVLKCKTLRLLSTAIKQVVASQSSFEASVNKLALEDLPDSPRSRELVSRMVQVCPSHSVVSETYVYYMQVYRLLVNPADPCWLPSIP